MARPTFAFLPHFHFFGWIASQTVKLKDTTNATVSEMTAAFVDVIFKL